MFKLLKFNDSELCELICYFFDSFSLLIDDVLIRIEHASIINLDNSLVELIHEHFETLHLLALVRPDVGAFHFFILSQTLRIQYEDLFEQGELLFTYWAFLVVFLHVINHTRAFQNLIQRVLIEDDLVEPFFHTVLRFLMQSLILGHIILKLHQILADLMLFDCKAIDTFLHSLDHGAHHVYFLLISKLVEGWVLDCLKDVLDALGRIALHSSVIHS